MMLMPLRRAAGDAARLMFMSPPPFIFAIRR